MTYTFLSFRNLIQESGLGEKIWVKALKIIPRPSAI